MSIQLKLGIQSFSLRKFSLEKALKEISELNLKYVEVFPGHVPIKNEIEEVKKLCKEYDLRIIAHGVNPIPEDKEYIKKLFDFAHKLEIEIITADPDPNAINLLDKFTEEYEIFVAIHNHGPNHRYSTVKKVLEVISNHSNFLGMCLDTGHLVRANGNVVNAVNELGERLISVHLKDVNEEKKDVVIGEGIIDFKNFFNILKEKNLINKVPIMIEYELEPNNPIPGIKKSLNYVMTLLKQLRII